MLEKGLRFRPDRNHYYETLVFKAITGVSSFEGVTMGVII